MLKAYSYMGTDYLDSGVIDKTIFDEESRIILEFANKNPTPKLKTPCLFCESETKWFDVINEVYYQRCIDCCSIFACVNNEIANKYKTYQPMIDFRNSKEYQESATKRRAGIWSDLLFWLKFRLARYLKNGLKLDVADVDNHYSGLTNQIKEAKLCGSYNTAELADVVLFFDKFRCLSDPAQTLQGFHSMLKDDGLLVMNLRVGSGFDVLTLKGCKEILTPYEVICLPSIEGLDIMLQKIGFEILETSTTGTLDVKYVLQNISCLREDDLFVHYLMSKADNSTLAEFQRFLQKSGMSSHARVIARKMPV